MDSMEKLLLENFKYQIHNCSLNTKRDFEEQKNNDPLYITRFRFEKYIEDLNAILENERKILSILNIDLIQECIGAYKEELIGLQKWYYLKTNIPKKNNKNNNIEKGE